MHFRLTLCVVLLSSLAGCTTPSSPAKSPSRVVRLGPMKQGTRLTIRTTAYTHTEPGGRKNACDGRLHYGGGTYSAASDWSWMPLGTRFKMLSNGRTYVIEDYGSALVGRQTVDLYMPTRRIMREWGMRHEDIEILEWGSPVMSLRLLEPRCRNSHVLAMVTGLRKQLADKSH